METHGWYFVLNFFIIMLGYFFKRSSLASLIVNVVVCFIYIQYVRLRGRWIQ